MGSNISPGSLVPFGSSSSDDAAAIIATILYYVVAVIVFLVYAMEEFGLFIAILYSLFWPFGILWSILC